MGVLVAFFVIAGFWVRYDQGAGSDALLYYLRYPPENATVPIWVYLVTYPLSFLGYPLSWQVLATATVFLASVVYVMRGERRWWLVVASAPMLYNAWWGQVEFFSILGLLLGLLVLQRKLHPLWLGVAWLLLAVKIQSNYGLLLLITWWFWREQGWRALLPGILTAAGVVALTLVIWPGWIGRLVGVYQVTRLGYANASVWPYGLAGWAVALLPLPMAPYRRMRMIAAASLLGSPYFTLHHCLNLMVLNDRPAGLWLSWLPMVMIWQTADWAMYAWVLPLGLLLLDVFDVAREWRARPRGS